MLNKILISLVMGLLLSVGYRITTESYNYASREISLEMVKNPSETLHQLNKANNSLNHNGYILFGFYTVFNLFLFSEELFKMKNWLVGIAGLFMLSMTGCMMPYHEEVYVDVSTNETPFFIEMVGDNEQATVQTEEYLKSKMVFMRRITIPYEWKQTTRVYFWNDWTTGKYVPVARLVLVDRSPVTREWTASTNKGSTATDQGIWVESKDSIGFSTGITITARIANDDDAVKFLFNYPPKEGRSIETSGGEPFNVNVTSLDSIMDAEVRGLVQATFAEEAARMEMDLLRESKVEILSKIEATVVPFFKERGITITNIGQFGGFTYENEKTQEAIDKVFQAQQDQEVAKAEAKAAEERKVALKLLGEGQAAQQLEVARGKAEAIRLEADAKAYEVEQLTKDSASYIQLKQFEVDLKRIDKWNGTLPYYYMGQDGGDVSILMQQPQQPNK